MTPEQLQAEMDRSVAESDEEGEARLAAAVEHNRRIRAEREAQRAAAQAAEKAAHEAEMRRIAEEHERYLAEEALKPPIPCAFCGEVVEPRRIARRVGDDGLHPECVFPWVEIRYPRRPGESKTYQLQVAEKLFRESETRFAIGSTCTICCKSVTPQDATRISFLPPIHLHNAECIAEYERRKAEEKERSRLESLRSRLVRDLAKKLEPLPRFRPCVGTPEFKRAVAEPDLRLAAKNWTPADGSLLILGPTGVGKTVTASGILQRIGAGLFEEPETVRIHEYDMYEGRSFTERYSLGCLESLEWTTGYAVTFARRNSPLGAEPPLLEKCKAASLLVIDEVGQEPVGDGSIFDVVDARHSAGLPTIVTSGLTRTAFREKYGDACDRRLTQEGIGVAIECVLKSGGLKVVK